MMCLSSCTSNGVKPRFPLLRVPLSNQQKARFYPVLCTTQLLSCATLPYLALYAAAKQSNYVRRKCLKVLINFIL